MVSTEELRAAIKWVERTPYNAHTSTLAAAVRELVELVDNAEQILMDAYSGGIDLDSWHGFYDDVQYAVDRYRSALEGEER